MLSKFILVWHLVVVSMQLFIVISYILLFKLWLFLLPPYTCNLRYYSTDGCMHKRKAVGSDFVVAGIMTKAATGKGWNLCFTSLCRLIFSFVFNNCRTVGIKYTVAAMVTFHIWLQCTTEFDLLCKLCHLHAFIFQISLYICNRCMIFVIIYGFVFFFHLKYV